MTGSPIRATATNADSWFRRRIPLYLLAGVALAALLLTGCATIPGGPERFNLHRQDQLAHHAVLARQAHYAAQDQFLVALDSFTRLLEDQEIPLRQRYDELSQDFTRTERVVAQMARSVDQMERAARIHFVDWENRLYEYADPVIRNASRRQLDATRQSYEEVVIDVRHLQGRTERVMGAFRDQMRFLSHNLNQQSVAALRNPAIELQLEIRDLANDLGEAAQRLDHVAVSFRVD